jgi:thiamine-phosphate pyrophosphorylase
MTRETARASELDRGVARAVDPRVNRGLYAIVDADALGQRDAVAFGESVLAAGDLFALQLRAKSWPTRQILEIARVLAHRCQRAGVPFYVNDRPDIAVLAGATGVHIGQHDFSVADVRRIAPGLAVGISTHDAAQFDRALGEGPEYIALGPIFATRSKREPDPVVGLEGLASAVGRAGTVPVVAIGGITLERARLVREAGAASAAVIAALAEVPDAMLPERARALHRELRGER